MKVEELLAKLVSFPLLGGESNLPIIHWIKDYIESFGITTTLVLNEEDTKASLHCRIGPAVDGGLILSGHTDVVPVKGQVWDAHPFTLTDKGDGNLYGRGTADMKGFLACCLAALPEMIKADLKIPIYFAFSYDEEIGCLAAPELAEHIKSTYTETPAYAIIGEPTLMQPIIGQKGVCYYGITVNGSAGHSSNIDSGISAIHEASKLIVWLQQKMKQLSTSSTDDRFNPPHSTLHIGQIQGGIAPNIIAEHCYFTLDVRSIPNDSIQNIINDFKAYCKIVEKQAQSIFPDFKIDIEELHPIVPSLDTNPKSPIVELMQRICGITKTAVVSYAAEAGQFSEAGFNSIICGPGSIAQAHRANEFIAKEQLQKGVEMMEKLILEFS